MTRTLLLSGFLFALAVAGPSVAGPADATSQDPAPDAPRLLLWGTGREALAYHRLSADCETLEHAHGRNAAWGLWRMPLSAVAQSVETDRQGGVALSLRCVDGSACIGSGRLEEISEFVSVHRVPFETASGADAFVDQLAQLRQRCGRS